MKYVCMLLCFAGWAAAEIPIERQPAPTPFAVMLHNLSAPDSSKSRLIITTGILYDDLSFARTDSGFAANYELALDLTNAEGELAASRTDNPRIFVEQFALTNSRRHYHSQSYEFDLPPGKYDLAVIFVDRVSGATHRMQTAKVLRAFSSDKTQLEISDVIFQEHVAFDSLRRAVISPYLFANITSPGRKLHLYFESFSATMNEPLLVRQTIRNWQNKVVVEQRREWPRRERREQILLPIWVEDLPYGVYEVEMNVQQGKLSKNASARFHVTWNGIPGGGVHLEQAIVAACELADKQERRFLQTALQQFSKEQKLEALRRFWEARDETPETQENEAMNTYYQRIEQANEKFSGAQEGWKTDFGKVFVSLGAPDVIEFAKQDMRAARVQVWHYNRLARRFLFIDAHGNGDFRLVQ